MGSSDRDAVKRRFWRRTVAGAGWGLVLLLVLALPLTGWLWYEYTGGWRVNGGPALSYSLVTVGIMSVYVLPVVVLSGALVGAVWAWVVDGCPCAAPRSGAGRV